MGLIIIWFIIFIICCYIDRVFFILFTILISFILISYSYDQYGFEGMMIGYIPSIIIENLIK